jgi:hypothetical protein
MKLDRTQVPDCGMRASGSVPTGAREFLTRFVKDVSARARSSAELRDRIVEARLGPAVSYFLHEDLSSLIPPEVASALKLERLRAVRDVLAAEILVRDLARAFSETRIRPVFLKGTYLRACVYEFPAARLMTDIDILAPPEQAVEAGRVCRKLGYEPASGEIDPGPWITPPAATLIPVSANNARPVYHIDLHWGVVALDFYRVLIDDAQTRSLFFPSPATNDSGNERRGADLPVTFLTPELNFIHLALHYFNHGCRPRDLLDLILLSSKVNTERLCAAADAIGARIPLMRALRAVSRWTPALNWVRPRPRIADLPETLIFLGLQVPLFRVGVRFALLASRGLLGRHLRARFATRASTTNPPA